MIQGSKVRLSADVDLSPDAFLCQGETGVVHEVCREGIYVRMDAPHPGLDAYPYNPGCAFFDTDARVFLIGRTVPARVTRAALTALAACLCFGVIIFDSAKPANSVVSPLNVMNNYASDTIVHRGETLDIVAHAKRYQPATVHVDYAFVRDRDGAVVFTDHDKWQSRIPTDGVPHEVVWHVVLPTGLEPGGYTLVAAVRNVISDGTMIDHPMKPVRFIYSP